MALKKPPLVVGIVGGSGSGKSSLLEGLVAHYGAPALLYERDYARSRDELAYPERVHINYEHPASYDHALLTAHLRGLRWGNSIDSPIYDRDTHLRSDTTRRVPSASLVLVTGVLLYADEGLASQFDLRIFLDTDADLRMIRHILQRQEEQQSLYTTVEQYLATGRPSYERFIRPLRDKAQLVITGDGGGPVALARAIAAIEEKMSQI